ncbi:hypothetical protein OXPF_43040 [Oxobacter pfennigii]|uniref:Uncharacterized protein n=1 Tax=Oxobacter pfennigii TaxID=36849 RepID=A0A0P9ABR3_9CLOT|nr:hypothetical protein [Oxobacter pfennigii]KPU42519.1 hypothetical protein OXPF_43040 [Oxobacter pfennigii]
MVAALKFISDMLNNMHDDIMGICSSLGLNLTDKELHFWIIGITGIIIFIIADYVFKKLSKWNVSIISFIYTFTVLIVLVFSLEIQQKITGRGRMDFADIEAGLYGFALAFGVYILLRLIVYLCGKLLKFINKKVH